MEVNNGKESDCMEKIEKQSNVSSSFKVLTKVQ